MLSYKNRLCVPNVDDLRNRVIEEAHGFVHSIHSVTPKCLIILEMYIGGIA